MKGATDGAEGPWTLKRGLGELVRWFKGDMEGLIGARRRLIGDWEVVKMGYREGYILVVI